MPDETFTQNETDTSIYSNDARDIISQKPIWIVRHGILLFLLIITAIAILTFFIEYPDIVNANAKLVSLNPPVELKTKQAGKIKHLNVHEQDSVKKGDILAKMEAIADAQSVLDLSTILIKMKELLDQPDTDKAIEHFNAYYNKTGVQANLGEL